MMVGEFCPAMAILSAIRDMKGLKVHDEEASKCKEAECGMWIGSYDDGGLTVAGMCTFKRQGITSNTLDLYLHKIMASGKWYWESKLDDKE